MDEDKTSTIIKALSLLSTPNGTVESKGRNEMVLEMLLRNVETVEEYLQVHRLVSDMERIGSRIEETSSEGNINRFLNICQKLLILLKENLQNETIVSSKTNTPKGILSSQHKKVVSSTVQLIVSFGLVPNFLNGIGIPVAKRSNNAKFIQSIANNSSSCLERQLVLIQNTNALLNCKEHPELNNVVYNHTSDILASLLQLAHSPISTTFPANDVFKEEVKQDFINKKKEMIVKLKSFLSELQSSVIIKEILVLIACNPTITPIWFRKICGKYLSRELVRPQAIQHIVSAVLRNESIEEKDKDGAYLWQQCDIVSKIVVGSCLSNSPPDEYFRQIFPQVIELLHSESKHKRLYVMVAINIFIKATEEYSDFANKYLWSPLIEPLLHCSEEKADNLDINAVREEHLSQCVNDLYQMFVLSTHMSEAMYIQITPVIGILFHLYMYSESTISNLKGQLLSILIAYLKHNNEKGKINFFRKLLFNNSDDKDYKFLSWNTNLEVGMGGNGGLCVSRKNEIEELSWMNDIGNMTNAVLALLKSLQSDNFVSPFFLMLLQEFTTMQNQLDELKTSDNNRTSQKLLIEIEENVTRQETVIKNSFLVINLFELISEDSQLQNLMMNDKIASFKLLKIMFSRAAGKKFHEESFEIETLTIAVTLTLTLASKKLTAEEKQHLEDLSPDLLHLSEHHPNERIRTMIEDLRSLILTDDANKPSDKKLNNTAFSEFQTLWDELKDPMVPVRGHALIGLRKLILKRDSETLTHADELLAVFQKNLDDDDSYIYLAAVQGLASLTERYTDKIVPQLASEFANFDTKKQKSTELRLKLGEVLLKVTQTLGEMLPKYRDLFLQAFLSGCKDDDSQIRASSLSNLGEVCKGLKFAIGPCIHEIMFCLRSLLKTDSTPEVKEACLLVITLLLRGLGKDMFQVLDSVLRDLFRLLRTIYTIERNDKIKLHAQLALEELNIATRKFINPEQILQKKIVMLDSP